MATAAGGSAWATGVTCGSACLTGAGPASVILQWTGKAWKKVADPAPAGASLAALAAPSASDAWAVGSYGITTSKTVILHWNGHSWK